MVVVALIAGSAIALRPAPRETNLTVWTFADPHFRTYQPLARAFEQRTGQTITVNLVQGRAKNIRLQSSFMSGDVEAVPDLVEMEISSIGQFFRPPVPDVGFVDLTQRLKDSGWYDRIVQTRFAPWSKRGHIFGVPHDVHPVVVTYRHDLFREADIDLPSCTTWPAFHDALVAFERYWHARGYPRRHAIELPAATADYVTVMLLQRGINLVDDRDRVFLADPRVAHTIAFYAQMVAGPRNVASESTGGQGSFTKDLQEGNICAFVTPDWRVSYIRRYGKNATDASLDLTGKMRMMPLPVFDATDARTATWGGTMIGIPKACPDPDRAWALLEYLYLSDDSLVAHQKNTDILPPVKSHWNHPHYHQPDEFFGGQMAGELLVDLADEIPPRYVTPVTHIAQASLAYVLNQAVGEVRAGRVDGLEQQCQLWLNAAAADVERRIKHWEFD